MPARRAASSLLPTAYRQRAEPGLPENVSADAQEQRKDEHDQGDPLMGVQDRHNDRPEHGPPSEGKSDLSGDVHVQAMAPATGRVRQNKQCKNGHADGVGDPRPQPFELGLREELDSGAHQAVSRGARQQEELNSVEREAEPKRHHERRDADERHPARGQAADRSANSNGDAHGEPGRSAELDDELGHEHGRDAVDGRDREIDLLDQQHEHEAERHDAGDRALDQQVREVQRGQEDIALEREERPQHYEADDDWKRPQVGCEQLAEMPRLRLRLSFGGGDCLGHEPAR
jgi:hypothetical protein